MTTSERMEEANALTQDLRVKLQELLGSTVEVNFRFINPHCGTHKEKAERKGANKAIIDSIVEAASVFFEMPIDRIKQKTRLSEVTTVRAMICYFLHTNFPLITKKELGRYFLQDHSTVISCCKRMDGLLQFHPATRIKYTNFTNHIINAPIILTSGHQATPGVAGVERPVASRF